MTEALRLAKSWRGAPAGTALSRPPVLVQFQDFANNVVNRRGNALFPAKPHDGAAEPGQLQRRAAFQIHLHRRLHLRRQRVIEGVVPGDEGCNCSTGSNGSGNGAPWSVLALFGLGALGRRRRRR